ncbi:hypothetical protein L484_022197 [Morus notabilis]|uniref:Uncharacterized protein n=1 Tax=Morus notabilis TaxID=981085 RepID=W9RAM8_9ROSA|nr:hypothetical protein L484_022197 [Morus notabilis]
MIGIERYPTTVPATAQRDLKDFERRRPMISDKWTIHDLLEQEPQTSPIESSSALRTRPCCRLCKLDLADPNDDDRYELNDAATVEIK